jgi:hypothetical protein
LERTLTRYGNTEFSSSIENIQKGYAKISNRSSILKELEGKQSANSAEILAKTISDIKKSIGLNLIKESVEILQDKGLKYVNEIQQAFNDRKGLILSPAEQQLADKLQKMEEICKNA